MQLLSFLEILLVRLLIVQVVIHVLLKQVIVKVMLLICV